jgi:hypothetical protein
MIDEVDGADAIRAAAEHLLRKADAKGRLPTPVDDIVAAAGLVQPEESLLSRSAFEQAPAHIQRALRKVRFKVRAVLDRQAREIHLDPTIHVQGRIAFRKLHEVTHDILPWQRELGYADDDATLSRSTNQLFERQANHGAAELLFQGTLFSDMAAEYEVGMAAILELAGRVGASGHAAFRRFIETNRGTLAGVVMDPSPQSRQPLAYRRHEVIASRTWESQFGSPHTWPAVLQTPPFEFVELGPPAYAGGSVMKSTWRLADVRNQPTDLSVEVYSNSYSLFVLIWLRRKERLRHRRLIGSS